MSVFKALKSFGPTTALMTALSTLAGGSSVARNLTQKSSVAPKTAPPLLPQDGNTMKWVKDHVPHLAVGIPLGVASLGVLYHLLRRNRSENDNI
jgi:hypothetical protein